MTVPGGFGPVQKLNRILFVKSAAFEKSGDVGLFEPAEHASRAAAVALRPVGPGHHLLLPIRR